MTQPLFIHAELVGDDLHVYSDDDQRYVYKNTVQEQELTVNEDCPLTIDSVELLGDDLLVYPVNGTGFRINNFLNEAVVEKIEAVEEVEERPLPMHIIKGDKGKDAPYIANAMIINDELDLEMSNGKHILVDGVRGPQGNKGNRGQQGKPGDIGDKGLQGNQGGEGPKGNRGPRGVRGRQGEKGDKGPPGVQGEAPKVEFEEDRKRNKINFLVDGKVEASIVIPRSGRRGARGLAGSSTTTPTTDPTITAGEDIGLHKVLKSGAGGAFVANSSDAAETNTAFGVSIGTATTGNSVTYAPTGKEIENTAWSWDTALPIWFDAAGALTQTPPSTGFSQIVAIVIVPTKIMVNVLHATEIT